MGKQNGRTWRYNGSYLSCSCSKRKGLNLKKSDLDYQQKEQQLEAQLRDEEERTKKLEEYKVYVKTKQFAEEVAKEKLGLVNPDEILLKPNK